MPALREMSQPGSAVSTVLALWAVAVTTVLISLLVHFFIQRMEKGRRNAKKMRRQQKAAVVANKTPSTSMTITTPEMITSDSSGSSIEVFQDPVSASTTPSASPLKSYAMPPPPAATYSRQPRRQSAVPLAVRTQSNASMRSNGPSVPTSPVSTKSRNSVRRVSSGADGAFADMSHWGFSMEDALLHAEEAKAERAAQSPLEVLAELQRGNARFWTGKASRPELSAFERRALLKTQFPTVAVLGCSDSRVPVEIVFDAGLGDMFVIRVAGNCLDTSTMASLQYAILHLKVKVAVVMGHEGCGAVKAAQGALESHPPELKKLLGGMKACLDEDRLKWAQDMRAHDREAVVTNVKQQVTSLTKDPNVMGAVDREELVIVGGFYEISSGIVDFFHEVSGDATGKPSPGVQTRFDPLTEKVTQ